MDGCSAQGCFLELTIQLIIIMVGQQFINNLLETVIPTVMKWRRDRTERKKIVAQQQYAGEEVQTPQWEVKFSYYSVLSLT